MTGLRETVEAVTKWLKTALERGEKMSPESLRSTVKASVEALEDRLEKTSGRRLIALRALNGGISMIHVPATCGPEIEIPFYEAAQPYSPQQWKMVKYRHLGEFLKIDDQVVNIYEERA